jgi:transposase InsO family protein
VDFVHRLAGRTELPVTRFVQWLGIQRGKFYEWRERYGHVNEHNASIPRDHWITAAERQAILDFHAQNPLEGYRRLAYMMIDRNLVAVSPSTVYRVLSTAGRLARWNPGSSRKGQGFVQPLAPHEHWHIDIAYVNISATFYYLCSILDGASRDLLHWEIRESMTESDVECVVQKARERFPEAKPRIISDNGPQFIARDFKEFIRIAGMTHVRTSPYYPQSNGKLERYHKTIKGEALRPKAPGSLEEARRIVERFVAHYNGVRLHSAIGYITPDDFLAGKAQAIWAERDRRLEAAREHRRQLRRDARLKDAS